MNENTNEVTEVTGNTEITETTEHTEAAEATENTENTGAEEAPEAAETAEAVETPETPKKKKRRGWIWCIIILLLAAVPFGMKILKDELLVRRNIEVVIASAEAKLGLPYRLGALGPYDYDCSSLVQTCFADAGFETPRLAVDIGYNEEYRKIESMNDLMRGDIVCWDTVEDNDLCDHVGIYLGGGEVLHASSWGLRPLEHLPFDIPLDISFLVDCDLVFLESWNLESIKAWGQSLVEDVDLSFIKDIKLPFLTGADE